MPVSANDFWWADAAMQARLLQDPKAYLAEAHGLNLPESVPVERAAEVVRVVSLLWQDGRVIPREQFRIDPSDEGLLFGKGIWESTRTLYGSPWLWQEHLARFTDTAKRLKIKLNESALPDAGTVKQFVQSLTDMEVIVRLNATAGSQHQPGTVWLTAALPPTPMASVRLQTARTSVPAGYPFLTWKTFQYGSRLQLGEAAHAAGFDTALTLDDAGNVLEGAHANIFLRMPSGWVTPSLTDQLLPGTVRAYLLKNSPLPIKEETIHRDQLKAATEIFVTNSNVGIVPVVLIDSLSYPIGPETLKLAEWLRQLSHQRN
jgi:branched-subunit amino acid aminotransferase/4-amino-4-deoxychorismate lyase